MAGPLELEALEAAARERLERGVYDYIAGGADAERTVADNLAAWSRLRLRPRMLRDVGAVSTATTMLGAQVPTPILVAPMAYHRMVHPAGEAASAAGAAAAGYRALVLTVDVPVLGNRLRDLRNQFRLPTGMAPANAPPAAGPGSASWPSTCSPRPASSTPA